MAAIEVSVDAPASVADLQPLTLRVLVKNGGTAPLTVPAPTFLRNVRIEVVALRTDSDRCSSHRTLDGVSQAGIEQVTIPAGGKIVVSASPAATFPLGLPAGRYRVTARYQSAGINVASAPVELTVIAPAGSPAYDQLIDLCHGIRANDAGVAKEIIAFVGEHPDFPYSPGLLAYARQYVRGEQRRLLEQALAAQFPATVEGHTASLQLAQREKAAATQELQRAYEAQYAAEMNKLSIDQRIAVTNALATIHDAAGYERAENFLARNSGTFFGAEALHAMLDAVHRGILPARFAAKDRDAVAAELRARLTREYPRSYWSRKVAEAP
jgi:hypothetical protein